jgi:hypothetical protein
MSEVVLTSESQLGTLRYSGFSKGGYSTSKMTQKIVQLVQRLSVGV